MNYTIKIIKKSFLHKFIQVKKKPSQRLFLKIMAKDGQSPKNDFACFANELKACLLHTARSASIFRSISIDALFKPSIKRL